MNLKINIKKLSPTLSIGAAAATAVPSIILYCQNQGQSVVINNFVGDRDKPTPVKTNRNTRVKRSVNMKPLPALNLNAQQTLGQAWKQYLLHSNKYELWKENEKALLSSSVGGNPSSYSIKSQLFKNARKVIQKNKKVTGRVIYSICKWSYEIQELSIRTEHVIRDVWNYCNVNNKAKKKVS